MRSNSLILLCALLFSGCASMVNTPVVSRTTHPETFKLLNVVRIDPGKVQDVSDCIHDGFSGSHGVFTNFTSRMNRRAAGYRIETAAGGTMVLVSVDVLDDGVTELRESKNAALIDTSGERRAFESCTSKFLIAAPR